MRTLIALAIVLAALATACTSTLVEDDVYIPGPDLSANVADMARTTCNTDGGLGCL